MSTSSPASDSFSLVDSFEKLEDPRHGEIYPLEEIVVLVVCAVPTLDIPGYPELTVEEHHGQPLLESLNGTQTEPPYQCTEYSPLHWEPPLYCSHSGGSCPALRSNGALRKETRRLRLESFPLGPPWFSSIARDATRPRSRSTCPAERGLWCWTGWGIISDTKIRKVR